MNLTHFPGIDAQGAQGVTKRSERNVTIVVEIKIWLSIVYSIDKIT